MRCRFISSSASNKEWREKYVTLRGEDLDFTEGPISSAQLQEHLEKFPVPADNYETEINLAALEWIEQLSAKIERGVVLTIDYGWAREDFYAPSRTSGTLRSVAKHRLVRLAARRCRQYRYHCACRLDQLVRESRTMRPNHSRFCRPASFHYRARGDISA